MANEHDTAHGDGDDESTTEETASPEIPPAVVDEIERLTRHARDAVDAGEATAYRDARDELLTEYEFTARVRDEEHAVLVLYPEEWVEGDTVRPERIENIDRGIERRLEGTADPDDWGRVAEYNRSVAADIEAQHGPSHGANARALAEFMNNHYAKPIEEATDEELTEFLTEYYPRNVWPTDEQKAVVERSVQLAHEHAITGRQ